MIRRSKSSKGLPPTASAADRALFRRLVDPANMLEVFRRVLGRAALEPIRVTSCRTKMRRTRASVRAGKLEVIYRVGVERRGEGEREYILFGTAPETAQFLRVEEARCLALLAHPAVIPFAHPAAYVDELRLALRLFPLDPALPALAEVPGPGAAGLLAAYLPECRAGATIDRVQGELREYKPCKRAVLRLTAHFSGAPERSRTLYVKLFADDRGARILADLSALWPAARRARSLRMPEPLGYDRGRRMLVVEEVPGEQDLREWVRDVVKGRPLPAGVDLQRLERCMVVAAEALAELQGSGLRPSRTRSYRGRLALLEGDLETLRTKLPRAELLREAQALLARLKELVPASETLVPAHGCFRHNQMVGDERGLYLVDWDGMCLADAAFDAAKFIVKLCREPLRDPACAPEVERLAQVFRREFLARRPEVSARALALQEGLVIVEDLLRSFRRPSDGERLERENRSLAAAAARMLDLAEGRRP